MLNTAGDFTMIKEVTLNEYTDSVDRFWPVTRGHLVGGELISNRRLNKEIKENFEGDYSEVTDLDLHCWFDSDPHGYIDTPLVFWQNEIKVKGKTTVEKLVEIKPILTDDGYFSGEITVTTRLVYRR